jgi:hypothetical protein
MELHTNAKLTIDGSIVFRPAPVGEPAPEPDVMTILDGEPMYRINRYDSMPPFLMSLVSDSDLWMYISSYGALTAGRIDEDHCLFPYLTDDQLHRYAGQSGPITTFRVRRSASTIILWEPFTRFPAPQGIERNCYKSLHSNRITFEEIHHSLGMTFRYTWAPSDRFGFVRHVTLENHSMSAPVEVDVVDGLVNLLPANIDLSTQQRFSCLLDAYTRCEVDRDSGIGIVALASLMVDRAEPAESLTAATVWSRGLNNPTYLLSSDQLPAFLLGQTPRSENLLTGRRGSFLVSASIALESGDNCSWDIVAEVGQDQAKVEALRSFLQTERDPRARVRESVEASRDALARIVASADGQQATGDALATAHHASCVLFNNMRGGVFARNYEVSSADFRDFVATRNRQVSYDCSDFLAGLPETLDYFDLLAAAARQNSPDIVRLANEYLPLTFSRRHGDPSRPWNRFAIRVKNADGSQVLNYQGNWRDIFQNWEALCVSYPEFVESIIAKFVNASTVDGFNPYRVMREGIEWEAPDPEDIWATIGYWGDHQIIYLLKFLEGSRNYHPGLLDRSLKEATYSYANVPYRIKSYDDILKDNRNTIVFDFALDRGIHDRVHTFGTDGKLVLRPDGAVYHVTLTEKLLVPMLSKLSNLVIGGGIWMNTQRPEWNDANNALVGNGISMVTLCYLRRYLAFCRDLFDRHSGESVDLSTEVAQWMNRVHAVLDNYKGLLQQPEVNDLQRRQVLDELGTAFSDYRLSVYEKGFTGMSALSFADARDLCDIALKYVDHTIRANRREDGLYHAYNLIDTRDGKTARVGRLYEMLEGQVAVLSAGILSPTEAGQLTKALFNSRLYRPDQNSFILYPNRQLPSFLEKNILPEKRVIGNELLKTLIDSGDKSIVLRDAAGNYRFNAAFKNAVDLAAGLDKLSTKGDTIRALIDANRQDVLDLYELVFDHHAFTGRSGGMYGYEGLGCIYWHMVSKLLVAAEESFFRAEADGASSEDLAALAIQYYRVREGMGFNKPAHLYGAFPADPYSHTPGHSGARQPGMTGQSKEDILVRWSELGVFVKNGSLTFSPTLLRRREFLAEAEEWRFYDLHGQPQLLPIAAGSLGFTVCQTPVVYSLTTGSAKIVAHHSDGSHTEIDGNSLTTEVTAQMFCRTGEVVRLEVSVPQSTITLD